MDPPNAPVPPPSENESGTNEDLLDPQGLRSVGSARRGNPELSSDNERVIRNAAIAAEISA